MIEPQQTGDNNGIIPPSEHREESAEVGIIRELSSLKVMNQLRMELKGYYWDYDSEKWVKIREPLMNDKGIGKYLAIIGSIVTDLVTFSNYDPKEIGMLVEYICEKAIPVIHINYKEYGIQEKSDLQIIDLQIFNLTKAALHKAMGAGDRNVVRGTYGEQNMYKNSGSFNEPKQGGFLSRINPMAK